MPSAFQWWSVTEQEVMAQIETQEILYECNKYLFAVWVIKPWTRLLREVVETPSVKTLKIHLDTALSSHCGLPIHHSLTPPPQQDKGSKYDGTASGLRYRQEDHSPITIMGKTDSVWGGLI